MAEDYKSSPQWQALNRIWKAVPQSARAQVTDDFRVITEYIKQDRTPAPDPAPAEAAKAKPVPRENYLAGLSPEAKKLALRLITKEAFDIYGFLEELAASTGAQDADELWDAYVSQRDIDDEDGDALREIMEACVSRRFT